MTAPETRRFPRRQADAERMHRIRPLTEVRDTQTVRDYLRRLRRTAAGRGLNRPTSWFFNDTLTFTDIMGARLRMVVEDNGRRYITGSGDYEMPEALTPTLLVRDPHKLLTSVSELSTMLGPQGTVAEREVTRWANHPIKTLPWIWRDATPSDLENPEAYIAKQVTSLKTDTFPELRDRWQTRPQQVDGQNLSVRAEIALANMEAPDELHFALSENKITPSDQLPVVRFRRVAEDAVEVMAIQAPTINNIIRSSVAGALDTSVTNPSQLKRTIGENPRGFLDDRTLLDDFLTVPDSELASFLRATDRAYQDRDKKIQELGKRYRTRGQLHGAPLGHLLSFILACEQFKEKGITKITLPMALPLGEHHRNEEIDERVANNLARVVIAAVTQTDGIEMRDAPGDDYIHLRLDNVISSGHSLFGQLLTNSEN